MSRFRWKAISGETKTDMDVATLRHVSLRQRTDDAEFAISLSAIRKQTRKINTDQLESTTSNFG